MESLQVLRGLHSLGNTHNGAEIQAIIHLDNARRCP